MEAEHFHQLSRLNKDFDEIIPEIFWLLLLEFLSLVKPWLEYQDQSEISQARVNTAAAAMIYFGLHTGLFFCAMGLEYTGDNRD